MWEKGCHRVKNVIVCGVLLCHYKLWGRSWDFTGESICMKKHDTSREDAYNNGKYHDAMNLITILEKLEKYEII